MRVIFCYYSYKYIPYPVSSIQPKERMFYAKFINPNMVVWYIYLVVTATLQLAQRYPSRCQPMPFFLLVTRPIHHRRPL